MKKILALLLAVMMLSCVAVAEEELPTHDFQFVEYTSFAGYRIEDFAYIGNFEPYESESQTGENWASCTFKGMSVAGYDNVLVKFSGDGDEYHEIKQCAYHFANSEGATFDDILAAMVSVYSEPVHTETTRTVYDTVEQCYGTVVSGTAAAKLDETLVCSRYAQWMCLDSNSGTIVLVDVSQIDDANSNLVDIVVRYTSLPVSGETSVGF